ncbi:MAG: hypothetical protein ACQESX_09765 [Bacteroidota bacterium]
MQNLKLPHRIVLVNYLSGSGKPQKTPEELEKWVSLAVIFETFMLGKTGFENHQLIIKNPEKTGHSMIDDSVAFLKNLDDANNPGSWLLDYVNHSNAYNHVLENLKENNLLVSKMPSFLGFRGSEKIKPASDDIKQIVKRYLSEISSNASRSLRDELTIRIVTTANLVRLDSSKVVQRVSHENEPIAFFDEAMEILKKL